jgi:phosphoribosylglycinamide formyltransferase-1
MKTIILISGRGSNLQSIINSNLPIEISAVISNNPDAPGLDRANEAGISTVAINHRAFNSRRNFDKSLQELIDSYSPNLIVMAGFMRILGKEFMNHYDGKILNIHPSLLPKYPGLHTHERAIANKDKIHGATVHFATEKMDCGPLIIRAEVPVYHNDTPDTLADRVLEKEHIIYPQVIKWYAEGKIKKHGDQILFNGGNLDTPKILGTL